MTQVQVFDTQKIKTKTVILKENRGQSRTREDKAQITARLFGVVDQIHDRPTTKTMSAFEGTYTTPLAGSYAILLDSFDNSIQELAQLLSLTLPSESSGEARNEFVAQLVTDARKAVPNHQLQTEEDGVPPKEPAQLVEDPQAKVAVIQHLASVVETHDLSRLNQNGKPKLSF